VVPWSVKTDPALTLALAANVQELPPVVVVVHELGDVGIALPKVKVLAPVVYVAL
jgi:hypothetical protein